MTEKDFVPYIPPEKEDVHEWTFKAWGLGALLAIIMAAANAYLGLKAGMTVSAAIPASVISIAVFTALYRAGIIKDRATVLEVNVAKTSAAAGEALAAGIVFTIPALLVQGLWTDVEVFPTMAIGLVGGLLGVIFTVPLRRVLINDLDLPFPEGVACTEVILASEEGGRGGAYVFRALGIGALWQLARDSNGFRLFSPHFDETVGEKKVRFWFGSEMSAALVGVGYIIGPRVSFLVMMGGVLGWLIIIPVIGATDGWPADGAYGFFGVWASHLRFVGVGAMVVGSGYTLVIMRKALAQALAPVFDLLRGGKDDIPEAAPIRTEHDLPLGIMFGCAFALIIPTFFIYNYFAENPGFSLVAAILMLAFAFIFSSIAAYIAGILGSSSNPISGVTIATLTLTSVMFMAIGLEGDKGMLTAIGVAAVICVAAAIGGDVLQELKTGQLLGSTPHHLQKAEFVGVIAAGIFTPFVLMILHDGSGIGSRDLPAPQAYVMASIVNGIFNKDMKWDMVALGGAISGGLIVWNYVMETIKETPEKKVPVMGVAVGVYLPFTTTFCIALGGFLKYIADRFIETNVRTYGEEYEDDDDEDAAVASAKESAESDGTLVASGLIAGEALMGVFLAMFVFMDITLFEYLGPLAQASPAKWHGLLAFLYLLLFIWYFGLRNFLKHKDWSEILGTLKEVLIEDLQDLKVRLGLQ